MGISRTHVFFLPASAPSVTVKRSLSRSCSTLRPPRRHACSDLKRIEQRFNTLNLEHILSVMPNQTIPACFVVAVNHTLNQNRVVAHRVQRGAAAALKQLLTLAMQISPLRAFFFLSIITRQNNTMIFLPHCSAIIIYSSTAVFDFFFFFKRSMCKCLMF